MVSVMAVELSCADRSVREINAALRQLPDGTSLGYTLSVTAISGPPTARIISLQVYVGGNY